MDPDMIEDFESALEQVERAGERVSDFLNMSDFGYETQLIMDDLTDYCDMLRRVTIDILDRIEEG